MSTDSEQSRKVFFSLEYLAHEPLLGDIEQSKNVTIGWQFTESDKRWNGALAVEDNVSERHFFAIFAGFDLIGQESQAARDIVEERPAFVQLNDA